MNDQDAIKLISDALLWFLGLTQHEHAGRLQSISGHALLLRLDTGPVELVGGSRAARVDGRAFGGGSRLSSGGKATGR